MIHLFTGEFLFFIVLSIFTIGCKPSGHSKDGASSDSALASDPVSSSPSNPIPSNGTIISEYTNITDRQALLSVTYPSGSPVVPLAGPSSAGLASTGFQLAGQAGTGL